MAQEIILNVNVNNEDAVNATKSLKTQLKEAQLEAQRLADKYGETSKEAVNAYKKTANVKEQIADLKQTIDAFHPEAKFNAIASVAQGLAGGFSAAEGAMALFGAESEDLQKQMLKVQAAMAFSQGLNELNGLKDGFNNLKLVVQNSAIYTKLAAAAQGVYNFVVGAGSTALSVFRGALLATGLGAIIVGIGLLAANWEKLNKWVKENAGTIKEAAIFYLKFLNPIGLMITGFQELGKRVEFVGNVIEFVKQKFSILAAAIVKLLENLNILDTAEENHAQAEAERADENVKNLEKTQKARERDIELAKAQGKSAQELRDMEIKLLGERANAYKELVDKKKKAGEDITTDEQEKLDESQHQYKLAVLENIRLTEDEEKKKLDERKKAWDKLKDEKDKQRQAELELDRQIQDEKVKLIKDDFTRELEEIDLSFSRRYEAIKGNGKRETELRLLLEQEKQQAVENLISQYEQQRLQKEAEVQLKKSEDKMSQLNADLINLQMNEEQTFDKEREILDQQFIQRLQFEEMSEAKLNEVQAQWQQQKAAIDTREKQAELKREQAIFNAKIQIGQNLANGLTALGQLITNNSKKQQEFAKAAAIVQLGVDTAKAISSTIAGATEAAAAGGPAAPFLMVAYITSGIATVLSSMATAKKALSSAGASAPSDPSSAIGGSAAASSPIKFNTTDNKTDLSALNKAQDQVSSPSIKVHVVESDISLSQKRVNVLEQKATF